jgi:hypothetical protein
MSRAVDFGKGVGRCIVKVAGSTMVMFDVTGKVKSDQSGISVGQSCSGACCQLVYE